MSAIHISILHIRLFMHELRQYYGNCFQALENSADFRLNCHSRKHGGYRMRKLAAIVSSVLLVAILAGCGGDKPAQGTGVSPASAAVSALSGASSSTAISSAKPSGASVSPDASATPDVTETGAAQPSPKSTADMQGESQQALDDLNQALKELEDMNNSTDTQNDIDNIN
jgi:hypothetical protein